MKHVCEGQCLLSCLQFAFYPFLGQRHAAALNERLLHERTRAEHQERRERYQQRGGCRARLFHRQRTLFHTKATALTDLDQLHPLDPLRADGDQGESNRSTDDAMGSRDRELQERRNQLPNSRTWNTKGEKKCGINNNSDDNVKQKILRHVPTFF